MPAECRQGLARPGCGEHAMWPQHVCLWVGPAPTQLWTRELYLCTVELLTPLT